MRWLKRIALTLSGAYLALCGLFWVIQDSLFFHPAQRPLADCAPPPGASLIAFDAERGIFTPGGGRGLLVFFHGNGGSACGWRYLGPNHVARHGFDSLVVEYPGYAGDARQTNAETIEALIESAAGFAEGYDRIAIMGFSMGTGMASALAQRTRPESVTLFAPFDSLGALVRARGGLFPDLLFRTRFDNAAALAGTSAAVSIIYGERDALISPEHSLRLVEALRLAGVAVSAKSVPRAGHNDLITRFDLDAHLARILAP